MMKTLYFASTASFCLALLLFWRSAAEVGSAGVASDRFAAAAPAARRFTLAEVAAHAQPGDCWMAIGDLVYDVSPYVPRHPAPLPVIADWCGKEATRAYATKNQGRPHSTRASSLLSQFQVGVLDTAPPF